MNAVTPTIQFIAFVQWMSTEAEWLEHTHADAKKLTLRKEAQSIICAGESKMPTGS